MGHLLFINKVNDQFESKTWSTVVESIGLSTVNYYLPTHSYGTTNSQDEKNILLILPTAALHTATSSAPNQPTKEFRSQDLCWRSEKIWPILSPS